MMINDGRACTQAVNALMASKPEEKPLAERQVETMKAYVFGHYDSRGGGALVLAANHIEALQKYMAEFMGFDAEAEKARDPEFYNSMVDSAQEDFIKQVTLVVCDQPLPKENEELDADYTEEGGYIYGTVEQRYEQVDHDWSSGKHVRVSTGVFSDWMETSVLVLWKASEEALEAERESDAEEKGTPDAPALLLDGGLLQYEHRIRRESFGEDACGLCLIR